MDYLNQSPYFKSDNLKRFILYRNIRTNKIRSINSSFVNMDVSNADISYALIHDLDVSSANITNLNVHHDITLNNQPYLPIGIVLPYASNTAPEGWLVCDGSDVSKNDYPHLYAVITNKFGDETTDNFKLPDLRGRVIVGSGNGSGLTARSIGDVSGAETHTLTIAEMPSHNHTGTTNTSGNHTHDVNNTVQKTGQNTPSGLDSTGDEIDTSNTTSTTTSENGAHTHTFTTNSTGGGNAHNNMQPFLVLNYIIKYRV